jgi:hypothetical protein
MIDPRITCRFAGLLSFSPIADLPLNGLSFSKVLNGVGPWAGSLPVEDPDVRGTAWINATAPNLTSMWVDIDETLVYGGRSLSRQYQLSAGKVALGGTDFCGYFAQRLQAKDYTAYLDPDGHAWATTGAPALRIAYYVLSQALAKRFSIPIKIVASGAEAGVGFWLTISMPGAQQQTLASILSQMQELGYMVGIDYAQDVAYVEGKLTATCTLSYPRRGSEAEPLTIDLSQALDLQYDEDGTEQADRVVVQAGATRVRSKGDVWGPSQVAGYPLLETQVSHTALAPLQKGIEGAALAAYVSGELTTKAYPLVAPTVTLPMFGEPSILELDVGQEVYLESPKGEGDLPPDNPRFPNGLKQLFRIVRIDCSVPDEGVPTMTLTLNIPAFQTPVEPPETEVKEPESAEEEARKIEAIKRAKEETAAGTVEAEEEAANKKAQEEKEAEEQREAEALLALQNTEIAAGLQSGLTPNEVSKMSAQELFEHNQHAAPGGAVGVVQKKLVRAEREAQNAREKSEQAQRTAEEAKGGASKGYGTPVSIGAVAYSKVETAEKTCLLIVYFGGKVKVFVNGGETAGGESVTGTITLPLREGDKWELVGAGFNQVSIANLE